MNGPPRLEMLPLADIDADPTQPRTQFDDAELQSLAESISQVGMLQPILARPVASRFTIVAGERRVRAARMAGLVHVPAMVWDCDSKDAFLLAVVENTSRSDLNPLEEAAAYKVLEGDLQLSQEQIALRVGRSRQHVGNTLRLLRLPSNVQRLLSAGLLSAGHARTLLPVRDPFACYILARRIIDEDLSVRIVEDIVRNGRYHGAEGAARGPSDRPHRPAAAPERPDGVDAIEDWLDTQLVFARPRGSTPGGITIRYADVVDRQRIIDLLIASARGAGAFNSSRSTG